MTEFVELPQVDNEPAQWLDPELEGLTDDEIAAGTLLGRIIDPDDDTDNGLS
jgi:hypothetical protein